MKVLVYHTFKMERITIRVYAMCVKVVARQIEVDVGRIVAEIKEMGQYMYLGTENVPN